MVMTVLPLVWKTILLTKGEFGKYVYVALWVPSETVKTTERIAPTVTVEETPGQKLRRRIEQQRQQQQRRSHSVGI